MKRHASKQRVQGSWRLGLVLTALLSMVLMGCPPSTGGGGGGRPVIDLAVADSGLEVENKGGGSEFERSILLYFDVLAGDDQQDPDFVITADDVDADFGIWDLAMTEDDLYAADEDDDSILIFRDYRFLGEDKGSSISYIEVDSDGLMDDPTKVLVDGNRLFVVAYLDDKYITDGRAVFIWDDAAGIDDDREADVILTDFDCVTDIAVANDHLYVADACDDRVYVFNSVTELLNDKSTFVADVTLEGASWLFLDNQGPVDPITLGVFNNHLYVGTRTNFLFVFNHAFNLENEQAPEAAISESNGALSAPIALASSQKRLFAGNAGGGIFFKGLQGENASVGMVAFDNATDLDIGQQPSLVFDTSNAQISFVGDLALTEDTLFVASLSDTPFQGQKGFLVEDSGDVHIFRHASQLVAGRRGDIVLPGLKDFFYPIAIAVNHRFTGAPQPD